jgi:iron complex transport system substrate-binding protein
MGRYFLYLICAIYLVGCCEASVAPVAAAGVVRTVLPQFAKGFQINLLTDSTTRIILFDLERNRDTLRVIDLPPQSVNRIACLSTTHLSMLSRLGALERIVAGTALDAVHDADIRRRIDAGNIADVGAPSGINTEKMMQLKPDLFFVYPFGDLNRAPFEKLGIECVDVSEYLEPDPLARAEWIILIGYACGLGPQSEALFARIRAAYERERRSPAAAAPRVMFVSSDGQYWYAPPGNSYAGHLLRDAGLHYFFADSSGTANLVMDTEKMLAAGLRCDALGMVGVFDADITAEGFRQVFPQLSIPCVQRGDVFVCNTAVSDYFGTAVTEPHLMLRDLRRIFFPLDTTLDRSGSPRYFRALNSGG